MVEAGTLTLTALISPPREDRERVRGLYPMVTIWRSTANVVSRPVRAAIRRGLRARARKGGGKAFTGFTSPCEEPSKPDLGVNTAALSIEGGVEGAGTTA